MEFFNLVTETKLTARRKATWWRSCGSSRSAA